MAAIDISDKYVPRPHNPEVFSDKIEDEDCESRRYVLDPPSASGLPYYNSFVKQTDSIWVSSELDFHKDLDSYKRLKAENPKLAAVVNKIMAFFSATDGVVGENIIMNFMQEVKEEYPYDNCRLAAYSAQLLMEFIHMKTYSEAIKVYIEDPAERNLLFRAAKIDPMVVKKTEWTEKFLDMGKGVDRRIRLVAFAATEGVFFISAFIIIFYLRSIHTMPTFAAANELISRDEMMHLILAIERYNLDYRDKGDALPQEVVHEIIRSAVDLEIEFTWNILPERIGDLIPEELTEHSKVLGNRILRSLGYTELWDCKPRELPSWLGNISLLNKSSFYEVPAVTNYKRTGHDKKMAGVTIVSDADDLLAADF